MSQHEHPIEGSWSSRVATFWSNPDDSDPDAVISAMKTLVDECDDGDPVALYEWASVHDFVGKEADAIPLYRRALEGGLSGGRRSQALIQLGSSLRIVGDPEGAIEVLAPVAENSVTGNASQAFLALALHDAGRYDEALKVALNALAPTLPLYARVVRSYADQLVVAKPVRPR